MARTLECTCGVVLTGADDEELYRLARQHADDLHREEHLTDDFLRELVRTDARDAA